MSLRSRALLLVAGALLLGACSSDKPAELEPSPLPKIAKTEVELQKLWSASVGEGAGEQFVLLRPAVSDGQVFVVSADGIVQAHDQQTGKRIWKIKTELPVSAGASAGYGLVVLGTAKGEVRAYDAKTGSMRWSSSLGAAVASRAAVGASRIVVMAGDGKVWALNRETGEKVWSFDTPVPALSMRTAAAPVIEGDVVFVGARNGRVSALGLESGEVRWELRVGNPQGRSELERMIDVAGDPLVDGESLFVASFQGALIAVDPAQASRRWETPVSTWQALAAGLGNVYVVTPESVIQAVDAATGKPVWQQSELKGRRISAAVAVGNYLLVGDFDGYVHVLAQADGRWVGREHFWRTGGLPVPPVVSNQTLFWQGNDGRVIAVGLK